VCTYVPGASKLPGTALDLQRSEYDVSNSINREAATRTEGGAHCSSQGGTESGGLDALSAPHERSLSHLETLVTHSLS